MNIQIWSLGKDNVSFIDAGVRHYLQKVKPWMQVDLELIANPKKSASADVRKIQHQEEELLLKRLQPHHYLILLDERGKLLDSTNWARQFQQCMNQSIKTVVLLIGGAYGVSENIRQRSNQVWSLSPLVFPHQMVRLIVAEQIYRAYSILNNSPYHHE